MKRCPYCAEEIQDAAILGALGLAAVGIAFIWLAGIHIRRWWHHE